MKGFTLFSSFPLGYNNLTNYMHVFATLEKHVHFLKSYISELVGILLLKQQNWNLRIFAYVVNGRFDYFYAQINEIYVILCI